MFLGEIVVRIQVDRCHIFRFGLKDLVKQNGENIPYKKLDIETITTALIATLFL